MQMPPPPPPQPTPSPSSSAGEYLGIPAMTARLKALEERIRGHRLPNNPQSASSATPTPTITTTTTSIPTVSPFLLNSNRNTSRNPTAQVRQTPTSLNSLNSARASSAPPTRKPALQLPLSPVQPVNNGTSECTQAKYQEALKNSGLLQINDELKRVDSKELTHISTLGFGSCGLVHKMEHKSSRTQMAVKVMHRTASDEENKRIIMDLDVIIKSNTCPYIVKCMGYFVNSNDVWICMELMASCFDKLLKLIQQPIPEYVLSNLTFCTVTALNYLKEKHEIIHRDVKPSNILIDGNGRIKLCDFGISGVLIESMANSRNAGCAAYMSPERIEPEDPKRPDYDIRADVWSLGITLIELGTNAYPYSNCRSDFDVMSRIVTEAAPQLPDAIPFSDGFRSFTQMCLIKDYKQRPKYKSLMNQPFFTNGSDTSNKVAQWYEKVTNEAMLKQNHQ